MEETRPPEHCQNAPARMCDFLLECRDDIVLEWERRVRQHEKAQPLTGPALRDHIPEILKHISDIVRLVHEERQGAPSLERLPEVHALERLDIGFDIDLVVRELGLLQDTAIELFMERVGGRDPRVVLEEVQQFTRAMAAVSARSLATYARARERTLVALDRISAAALGRGELDAFLPRLLQVVLETTAAVDYVTLFLREGDRLRVHAAAGPGAEASLGFTLAMGESLAGQVAATNKPRLVSAAATDALVTNPTVRKLQIRALYAVPLVHEGKVIGVAEIGSRSAYDLSREDRQLLFAMAQRATAMIVQAQLLEALRQREAALKESDTRFRALADNISQLAWIAAASGEVTWVNQRWVDYTGMSAEATHSESVRPVIHPDYVVPVLEKLQRCFEAGEPWEDTFPLCGKDGRCRWFLSRAVPIRDESGQVVRWFGTSTDINDLRETEEKLRAREEELARLLRSEKEARADAEESLSLIQAFTETTNLGFAYLDRDCRYVLVNEALARMNGVSVEEHLGRTVREVLGPVVWEIVGPPLEESLATGRTRTGIELAVPTKGESVYRSVSYHPVHKAGEIVGVGAVVADVTVIKRAELEARHRADFAQELVAIASHDLRAPLSAMLLAADSLLRRSGGDERQRTALERMRRSAERMTRLVADLLDFTRAQVGEGIPVAPAPLDLDRLVRQVVEETRIAHPQRTISLDESSAGEGRWDPDRIAQVLTNLLSNAVQHGRPDAPVLVRAKGTAGEVTVSVSNAGAIPQTELGQLFEAYRRGRRAAREGMRGGLGLGLYITKQIVERHGGTIDVKSDEASGTTFTVTLPRERH